MKIIVISLPNAHERRKSIAEQMQRLGLSFEFYDAVNGREIPEDTYSNYVVPQAEWKKLHRTEYMTPGELGCLLSHKNIMEQVANGQDETALILEDDVKLDDKIVDLIKHLPELKIGWDLINLYHGAKKTIPIFKLCPEVEIVCPKYTTQLAMGYIITKNACRKFLDTHRKAYAPIDIEMQKWWKNNLKVCSVGRSMISLSSLSEDSTISKMGRSVKQSHNEGLYPKAARRLNRAYESIVKRLLFKTYTRSFNL